MAYGFAASIIRAAFATASLAACASAALAQSFTGFGPAPRLALPVDGSASAKQPDEGGQPLTAADQPAPALQRLPSQALGRRLAGEDASRTWPVFLTEGQAAATRSFQIGYLSAISVAPEASTLALRINGTLVGRMAIRAPGAVKIASFDLPPGLLRPGFNAVRLDAVQRHRVDCSLGATHELWTQIDPARTGFAFAPTESFAPETLRDLPGVPTDETGAMPISVVMAGRPDLSGLTQILRAVQAVVLAGRFSQPVIRFGSPHAGRAGLVLVVGPVATLAPLGLAGVAPGSGPRVVLRRGQDDQSATLIVTGENDTDVSAAIASIRPETTPLGTPAGLQALALAGGFRVSGDERVTLAQMGLSSRDFSGRLGRSTAQLALPQDFLAADYGKAVLRLRGGYAAGLEPGAQVMVDLNGRNVANVRLPRASGDLFHDVELQLPLSRWRPGSNLLEISAEVPTPADRVCDTSLPAETRERFLLLDTTSIQFPTLARVLKIPDLAATAGGGSSYGLEGARPRLILPVPDADTASAAATFTARLAKSAGRVIDFELTTTRQLSDGAPTVIIAPVRALDPLTISTLGLSPDQVRDVWQTRAEAATSAASPMPPELATYSLDALRGDIPAACAAATASSRYAVMRSRERTPTGQAGADGDPALATRWEGLRKRLSLGEQISETLTGLVDGVVSIASHLFGYARDRVTHAPVALPASTSLMVGQGLSGPRLDQLLTVVTAPNAQMLRAGMACLVDPRVWNRLDGRLAYLDGTSGDVTTVPVDMLDLVATQSPSIRNTRLVLAGWLSLNPLAYVGLTLAAAFFLGWTTTTLVRQIGRRS